MVLELLWLLVLHLVLEHLLVLLVMPQQHLVNLVVQLVPEHLVVLELLWLLDLLLVLGLLLVLLEMLQQHLVNLVVQQDLVTLVVLLVL